MIKHIVVAGAGLAGLSSAVWLAERGHRVTLVEKRGRLGGRTMSFEVSGIDGLVDNGPHLLAGFYDRTRRYLATIGSEQHLLWDAPPFAIRTARVAEGEQSRLLTFRGLPGLPIPLERAAGWLWLASLPLPWRDRVAALPALLAIGRAAMRPSHALDELTVDEWFLRLGVPPSVRHLVLDQLVIGLLNEKTERVSAFQFAQTLNRGLEKSRENARAGDAVWPKVSLHELFVAPAERFLAERGGTILRGNGVRDVELEGEGLAAVLLEDGARLPADAAVLALPPWSLTRLLDGGALSRCEFFAPAREIESAPISTAYVWLDRSIGNERYAENLRDSTIEWVFDTTWMHGDRHGAPHCYALAVSASWDVLHIEKDRFLAEAMSSLRAHYPAFAEARVLRTCVVHQPDATFSAVPGFESLRLPQKTPIPNLFLAGDWTRTGLPSTMEAAVESGARAVDAVVAHFATAGAHAHTRTRHRVRDDGVAW